MRSDPQTQLQAAAAMLGAPAREDARYAELEAHLGAGRLAPALDVAQALAADHEAPIEVWVHLSQAAEELGKT